MGTRKKLLSIQQQLKSSIEKDIEIDLVDLFSKSPVNEGQSPKLSKTYPEVKLAYIVNKLFLMLIFLIGSKFNKCTE